MLNLGGQEDAPEDEDVNKSNKLQEDAKGMLHIDPVSYRY